MQGSDYHDNQFRWKLRVVQIKYVQGDIPCFDDIDMTNDLVLHVYSDHILKRLYICFLTIKTLHDQLGYLNPLTAGIIL